MPGNLVHMEKNRTMEESRKIGFIQDNNRGASLLIVLGMFVVLTVIAMNMLMLASAGDNAAATEYETEQRELYISSIYGILNEKMQEGLWKEAFVPGETTTITVDGFEDAGGTAVPVTVDVMLTRNLAETVYRITYQGETYRIPAKYIYYNIDGEVTITLKTCEEMIHE